jgi:hypothetical protein
MRLTVEYWHIPQVLHWLRFLFDCGEHLKLKVHLASNDKMHVKERLLSRADFCQRLPEQRQLGLNEAEGGDEDGDRKCTQAPALAVTQCRRHRIPVFSK